MSKKVKQYGGFTDGKCVFTNMKVKILLPSVADLESMVYCVTGKAVEENRHAQGLQHQIFKSAEMLQ